MATKRKVSAATRKKISDALKKFYASGAKKGQRTKERSKATRARNMKSLQKTSLKQQRLVSTRKIIVLRNQKLNAKGARAKQIQSQIQTLLIYRRNLDKRIKALK